MSRGSADNFYRDPQVPSASIGFTACCVLGVCPAMNQGTFKYMNLSGKQEESSLKIDSSKL